MEKLYNLIPGPMDMVRKLILDKLAEKDLSMKDASLAMGHAHSYLYQFLKRGIPPELKEPDRISLAAILGVPEDDLRGPSTLLPKRNYEKTLTSRKSLVDPDSHPAYVSPGRSAQPTTIIPGSDLFGKSDLPVFGTAPGGAIGAIVTKHAVDWTVRPPSLLRVTEGYGLIVPDDTMHPEHRPGSIVLINPHLPPKHGESCVLRSIAEDGSPLALIREYRGETDTAWKVCQHKPPKGFTLKKSAWTCQKVVGNYSA